MCQNMLEKVEQHPQNQTYFRIIIKRRYGSNKRKSFQCRKHEGYEHY